MTIKHSFVSQKSDGSDDTLVRPSNWNADHDVDMDFIELSDVPSSYTGQAGKVPMVKSAEDGLEFGRGVGARICLSLDWAIPYNTKTIIPFDSVAKDDFGFYDSETPGILTVPANGAGWHVISASYKISSSLSTYWGIYICVNGNDISANYGSLSYRTDMAISTIYYLSENDAVSAQIHKSSSTSRDILASSHSHLSLLRII